MTGFASAQAAFEAPPGDGPDLIECPTCEGQSEIGVRQDYWGNWETRRCPACDGEGSVPPLTACILPLTSGLSDSVTDVDAVDFAAAAAHRWYLGGGRKSYAVTTVRVPSKRMLYLHRFIATRAGLLLPDDDTRGPHWARSVDHIDGDKLNNRRGNLRVVDRATQSGNPADGARRTSSSGHRGVYLDSMAPGLPWHAQGTIQRRTVNLGRFATIEEAVAARRNWEIEVGRRPREQDDDR